MGATYVAPTLPFATVWMWPTTAIRRDAGRVHSKTTVRQCGRQLSGTEPNSPSRPTAASRQRPLSGRLAWATKQAVPERVAVTNGTERAQDDGRGEQGHGAP